MAPCACALTSTCHVKTIWLIFGASSAWIWHHKWQDYNFSSIFQFLPCFSFEKRTDCTIQGWSIAMAKSWLLRCHGHGQGTVHWQYHVKSSWKLNSPCYIWWNWPGKILSFLIDSDVFLIFFLVCWALSNLFSFKIITWWLWRISPRRVMRSYAVLAEAAAYFRYSRIK